MLWLALGGIALSDFRIARLEARCPGLAIAEVRELFLVELSRSLDAAEQQTLEAILALASEDAPAARCHEGFVLPRRGTRSPWSSKAMEILAALELPVRRIERALRYRWRGVDPEALQKLSLLHDPLVEELILDSRRLAGHFEALPPGRLQRLATDHAALREADRMLGLSLGEAELAHLQALYRGLGREATDAELVMFAQVNSEHCRHKVFKARWIVNGAPDPRSLFDRIRATHEAHPAGTLVAYRDNAAVLEGSHGMRLLVAPDDGRYRLVAEDRPYSVKVETHNHPTAIAPFPGAATGAGGEIRDESACGRGGRPKAGLTGFATSHLRIPGLARPWEEARALPARVASALRIMLEGPIGAASFNNEFGRPALCGFFRTFEARDRAGILRNFDKPIMIAGGIGTIRPMHLGKRPLSPGDLVVVLGGPAMRIGLGGGSASSRAGGAGGEALDFASVQRDNPEMQRRCQEVIDRLAALGEDNPVLSLHDVGAGGLSNAVPELLEEAGVGGEIDLAAIPSDDPSLSPMELWCNEAQERYVLAIAPGDLPLLERLCRRERCPFAVIGRATAARRLRVVDSRDGTLAVDLPMAALFEGLPRMERRVLTVVPALPQRDPALLRLPLAEALPSVLRFPAVAAKPFLITIGDRTVGGLCARDPLVGPWQVPVADCAVTLAGFSGREGEAMAIGERPPLSLVSPQAAARIALGEALTNLAAADVRLSEVRLSANWMAAVDHPGEDAALHAAVEAMSALAIALGLSIPVGKDSLSMRVRHEADGRAIESVAPLAPVVSAFARVRDVERTLTPLLSARDGLVALIDLGGGADRLGQSALAQCFGYDGGAVPDLDQPERLRAFFAFLAEAREAGLVRAYHDRSDGGLITALLEMGFASRKGFRVEVPPGREPIPFLFAEELGALLEIDSEDWTALGTLAGRHGLADGLWPLARVDDLPTLRIEQDGVLLADLAMPGLLSAWWETTHAMKRLRDDPLCADEERAAATQWDAPPSFARLTFDPRENPAAPCLLRGRAPKVAILREQGSNGQLEMAAAFLAAGFEAFDVHMSDLLEERVRLDGFDGLAVCGGFSFGDVLGAGRGWATVIAHHRRLRDAFAAFFADPRRFVLGVCNGCQMLAELAALIPGAEHWPRLRRNRSEQFEARLALVEVLDSPSLFFRGMAGSVLPVAVAHGEGRMVFATEEDRARVAACLRYVDGSGHPAERYPANPNGSPGGITGLCNADGRITILMPHPERVFLSRQLSWRPADWPEESPWLRFFLNARAWLG
jgi:phosphoribosylformylglycinamidine synthase